MTNPNPTIVFLFIYLFEKKKKGKAKPLLFFIFSRDQMVLQNHMITQMHLNKNTKTNPLTYASVACFWLCLRFALVVWVVGQPRDKLLCLSQKSAALNS